LATESSKLALIQFGISQLFKPGQLIEFRVQRTDKIFRGFYFDDHDKLADIVSQLDDDPRVTSLYYVINPIKPSLIRLRAECQCEKCTGGARVILNPAPAQVEQILTGGSQHLTADDEVELLQNVLIDFDTIRAPYLKLDDATKDEFSKLQHECSTAEEKRATREVAKRAIAFLDAKGWPSALLADSGNGYHVVPRVQMDNTVHNANMLLDVRKALAARFNCDEVKIDASVGNPSRLTRAYGTMTRKGTNTAERPYRRNQLMQTGIPVQEVPLDLILNMASELPGSGRRKDGGMPVPTKEFDPEDYFEWFATKENHPNRADDWKPAFEIVDKRKSGDVVYYITDTCLIAGHRHTGSDVTGFAYGKSFGYHCFSSDCEGITLKDLHAKLVEDGYERYDEPIFEQDVEAEFEELQDAFGLEIAEDDKPFAIEDEPELAVAEPSAPGEPPKPKRLRVGRVKDHATWMLSALFRDPLGVLPKFLATKSQIAKTYIARIEEPIQEVLLALMAFYEETKLLPSKAELKNFILDSTHPLPRKLREKGVADSAVAFIDSLEDAPDKEFAVQATELGRAVELEKQKQVTQENFKRYLKEDENVALFRNAERKHWQNELRDRGEILEGPLHKMTAQVADEFRKDIDGINEEGKFKLGLAPIDNNSNIGLQGERSIFVYGPASTFKTTTLMTIAVNAAMGGKNGLILVGEHQGLPMMKTLTLMLGHFAKDDPEIGVLPDRKGWEGLERTATKEDYERVRVLLKRIHERDMLPGILGVQNIDAITMGEEDRLGAVTDYIHAFNLEYPLDFVVIDPLDWVMPLSAMGRENAWQEAKDVLQRIQSLTRNFEGHHGKGLMVITSAQFTSKFQREVEKHQAKNASSMDQQDDQILHLLGQASQVQFFTTIPQVFDFGIGVATRIKGGRDGYLVRGRNRFLSTFVNMPFHVDPVANILLASGEGTTYKAAAAAAPDQAAPTIEAFDVL
jgi:RecA/RadA recombinase